MDQKIQIKRTRREENKFETQTFPVSRKSSQSLSGRSSRPETDTESLPAEDSRIRTESDTI